MLHPYIEDGVIMHEVGAQHNVDRQTLMLQCYNGLSQQFAILEPYSTQTIMHSNTVHIVQDGEQMIGGPMESIIIDSWEPSNLFPNIRLGIVSNPIILSQKNSLQYGPLANVHNIYIELKRTVEKHLALRDYH